VNAPAPAPGNVRNWKHGKPSKGYVERRKRVVALVKRCREAAEMALLRISGICIQSLEAGFVLACQSQPLTAGVKLDFDAA
jgi:hypothetical protein